MCRSSATGRFRAKTKGVKCVSDLRTLCRDKKAGTFAGKPERVNRSTGRLLPSWRRTGPMYTTRAAAIEWVRVLRMPGRQARATETRRPSGEHAWIVEVRDTFQSQSDVAAESRAKNVALTGRKSQRAAGSRVKISLRRIRLDRQGYTVPEGRYFGIGAPLFEAEVSGPDIELYSDGPFRAADRAAALQKVRNNKVRLLAPGSRVGQSFPR